MDPLALYSGGLIKPAEVLLGQGFIFLFEAVSSISAEPGLPGLLVPACCNPTGEHRHIAGQHRTDTTCAWDFEMLLSLEFTVLAQ